MTETNNNEMVRDLVDYNTDREALVLPEYGRSVQNMVEYCVGIADRAERQRCANTIIQVMSTMKVHNNDETEFKKKLWNHLAAMSDYKLDIDYPYEIERMSDRSAERETIEYPQKPIAKRHYGSLLESLTKKIGEIEDKEERDALIRQVANHMKRSLGRWNKDAMTEDKVLDDLRRMTDGAVSLKPGDVRLISDNEILNEVQQSGKQSKKKKKKK